MRLTLRGSQNLLPYLLNPIAECLRLRPICFIPEFHFTWTQPKRTKGERVVVDQGFLQREGDRAKADASLIFLRMAYEIEHESLGLINSPLTELLYVLVGL